MTDSRSQSNYQVRLGWGIAGLEQLATSDIVVIVDAIDDAVVNTIGDAASVSASLATRASALPQAPTVFVASLRNVAATAEAIVQDQIARGGRSTINLVLVGDSDSDGNGGGFAVEDYLAAGALGDALSSLGLDHSAPDLAVAIEGFRPLTRAVKHLFSASAAGLQLAEAGRRDDVRAAAELNADPAATRVSG